MSDKNLDYILEQNRCWAEEVKKQDGDFFTRLSAAQQPKILWIGCSDSRVPAGKITGTAPGEMFVHRNIANVAANDDINCQSVIFYAVTVLKVEHIVVCGHYGCGGVLAAMEDKQHGLIDDWLKHIKEVRRTHADTLANTPPEKRADVLCELNVKQQLQNIANSDTVKKAWQQGQNLTLHGWIYNMKNGLLKRLEMVEGK